MRVLYHHRTASKDGQAVHIEEMIEALRSLGHEVHVVAPSQAEDDGMGQQVGWVKSLRSALPKAVYELLEISYTLVAYLKLMRVARAFKPDVIYERYNLYLLAGLLVKRRLGIPLLLEVNAPLAYERAKFGGLALARLASWAEGTAWRGADFVLPVTGVLAQHLYEAGVDKSRVVVVPNGINEEHFSDAPSVEEARARVGWNDAFVLGFTGFVRDWHGVDRVISWMATPQAPSNVCLLVVGDGPVRATLEHLAETLGIGSRVSFTGFVPRTDVPGLVSAFDVALQPAVTPYASPLKLFEYMALGKAIIAPRLPNIEEILSDGENAVLFDHARPGSMESVLTSICADADLRKRIGEGARETIHRLNLTWRGNAERVTNLVRSIGQSNVSGMSGTGGARPLGPGG
jgi:glycosyltransferase involved in cell wall biosynthesis